MAFFDRLNEMAKTVSEKTNDSLEINKLIGEINLTKGNIQSFQRELGEHFWAKFVTGEQFDDEAMMICDKIVAAQDKIHGMEAQIAQIKAEGEARKAEREAERAERKAAEKAAEAEQAAERAGIEKDPVPVCTECGTEPIGRLLLKFSVPTALTLMVNCLYNIVDQIFIGHAVGIKGVAATNVTFPIGIIAAALALLIGGRLCRKRQPAPWQRGTRRRQTVPLRTRLCFCLA